MATTDQILQLRNTIENITANYLSRYRPMARYGTVSTSQVDPSDVEVDVILNGEAQAVTIPVGQIKPTGSGDVVRIEGGPSDRRITEIITPARGQAALSRIRTGEFRIPLSGVQAGYARIIGTGGNAVQMKGYQWFVDSELAGPITFRTVDDAGGVVRRRFQMNDAANYSFGNIVFRDGGDTFTSNDYYIGMASNTTLRIAAAANGVFAIARASDGQATFVVRPNGTSNPQYEFQSVDTTTAAANLMVTGTLNQLRKVTSLGKDKLFQQPIPVNYKIFDIEPRTWLDRQMVADDPNFKTRFGGAVAEQVASVIGQDMPTMLVWDEKTGALQSVAYDRGFWHAIPTFKDMVLRITVTEKVATALNAAGLALEKRVKMLEDALVRANIKV